MTAVRRGPAATLLVVAAGAGLLTSCSQVAALAPVGGDHQTTVRFAALDVLQQKGVPLLVAPACTSTSGAVECTGTTQDNSPVTVRSAADQPDVMTVTVGSTTLYQGSVQAVLDQAARPTS